MSKMIYMECTLDYLMNMGESIKPLLENGKVKHIDKLYYLILNN